MFQHLVKPGICICLIIHIAFLQWNNSCSTQFIELHVNILAGFTKRRVADIAFALKSFNLKISQLQIEMELGSTEAIKTYLRNSDCMAFLSVHSVFTELSSNALRIIDVEGLMIERFFYFIERQGTSEQLAHLFMTFAKRYNLK